MNITDTGEAALINHWVRGATQAQISWFMGLFSVSPDDASAGTEVVYTNYAREPYAPGIANWTPSADFGTYVSANDINFPSSGAVGDTAVAVGLFDAATGGNLWAYRNLTSSVVIPANSPGTIRLDQGIVSMSLASIKAQAMRERIGGLMFGAGWAKDAAYFAHLWTTEPDAQGNNGTRVSGGGYTPVSIPLGDTNWTIPNAAGVSYCVPFVAYDPPTSTWGTPAAWTMETNAAGTGDIVGIYTIPAGQRQAVQAGIPYMRWTPNTMFASIG